MSGRMVEAILLTALAAVAIWLGPWYGWMQIAEVGVLAVSTIAAIAWLSLLFTRNAPASLEHPTVAISAPHDGGNFVGGSVLALFAIVPLVIYLSSSDAPLLVLGLPLGFAIATALVAGWTSGVAIDSSTRVVQRWVGFRAWARVHAFSRRQYHIATGATVVLAVEYRPAGKGSTVIVYTVGLDAPLVKLCEDRDHDRARLVAETCETSTVIDREPAPGVQSPLVAAVDTAYVRLDAIGLNADASKPGRRGRVRNARDRRRAVAQRGPHELRGHHAYRVLSPTRRCGQADPGSGVGAAVVLLGLSARRRRRSRQR